MSDEDSNLRKRKVSLSTLGTIILRGLDGDKEGVRAYAELLIENATKEGATETAEFVRKILSPGQQTYGVHRVGKGPRIVGKVVNGKMVLNPGEER